MKIPKKYGPLLCTKASNYGIDVIDQNVLLPNGDVCLCCMDYGMDHVLGNLLHQDYDSLFTGEKFLEVKEKMKAQDSDIMCRVCTKSVPADKVPSMKEKEAKARAKEATKGVIDSIKWLDDMDTVVVVLDATKDPYSQVNITIIGNLDARKIPVLIVANKIDLKKAKMKKIEDAFPQYDVVGISAKYGKNIDRFYEGIFTLTS